MIHIPKRIKAAWRAFTKIGPRFKDSSLYAGVQPSEEFEKAFSSHGGGYRRDCECGRQYFNDGGWDWDEGELEHLRVMAENHPEGYIELGWSCSGMEVGGEFIVYDCPCGRAKTYEELFKRNAEGIADYLNRRARMVKAEADRIVAEETVHPEGPTT